MNQQDQGRFAELMTSLGEYYTKQMSESMISMYWQGLQRYDIEAIQQAFNRHVNNPDTGQFMPKIADVSKMLGGTSNDKALRAWAKVDKAVRQVGNYQSVAFDDPLIHRVLHDMGGWIAMGQKNEDEWPFVAKEFENRYRGYSMRGERPEYPPVLIGISEAHNAKGGHRIDPPMLIGNPEQAMLVKQGGTDRPAVGFISADRFVAGNVVAIGSGRESA